MRVLIGQNPMVYYTGKPIEKRHLDQEPIQARYQLAKKRFGKVKKQSYNLLTKQALLSFKKR